MNKITFPFGDRTATIYYSSEQITLFIEGYSIGDDERLLEVEWDEMPVVCFVPDYAESSLDEIDFTIWNKHFYSLQGFSQQVKEQCTKIAVMLKSDVVYVNPDNIGLQFDKILGLLAKNKEEEIASYCLYDSKSDVLHDYENKGKGIPFMTMRAIAEYYLADKKTAQSENVDHLFNILTPQQKDKILDLLKNPENI